MSGILKGAQAGSRLATQLAPKLTSAAGQVTRTTAPAKLANLAGELAHRPQLRERLTNPLTGTAKDFAKEARDDAISTFTGRSVTTSPSVGGALYAAAKKGVAAATADPVATKPALTNPAAARFLANTPATRPFAQPPQRPLPGGDKDIGTPPLPLFLLNLPKG